MKKIFLLFLVFCAFSASAQFVNDTIPSLPYTEVYYNDFEVVEDWNNFNGGTTAKVGGNLEIRSTNGGSRGAIAPFTNEPSTDYMMEVFITDPGSGVQFFSQWANSFATVTTAGWHRFKYRSDATAGGFGNNVIIAVTQTDTIRIGFVRISKLNTFRDIPFSSEVADSVYFSEASPLYFNSFSRAGDATRGVLSNNATLTTFSPTNNYAEWSMTAGTNRYVSFGPLLNGSYDSSLYLVDLSITVVSGSVRVQAGAEATGANTSYQISGSGHYAIPLYYSITSSNNLVDRILITTNGSAATIRVHRITITKLGLRESFKKAIFNRRNIDLLGSVTNSTTNTDIAIGQNAQTIATRQVAIGESSRIKGSNASVVIGYNALDSLGGGLGRVVIGENARVTLESGVAIGANAEVTLAPGFSAFGGPEGVAIGETAKAYAWRAVALGGNAFAGEVSSLAVGGGATTMAVHGTSLGRGAYVPRATVKNVENSIGGDATTNLYVANSWGHQFDVPEGGIAISSFTTPSTRIVKFHGQDALDARAVPSSFNVNGGHLRLVAGLATGSGESGSMEFAVGVGNNGQNVNDSELVVMRVKSEQSITAGKSYVWIYNPATGTEQQVLIKNRPSTAGTYGIVGFQRLSL